ncbi:MAG: 30S ribosomal protein S6 [Campylobacter lanienae]|uniref:30S ribosomal protein S6 n=1 Tax=Campylobacter TaxID=194 RepID=UPI000A35C23D|nr:MULTISPECIES: 30S ribosomal protein S6 [Campylobacter]MCI5539442.1 30S ribosomal protein S6 [Campylobacter lanienae]MDD7514852.1 30S ribosomal protein S6 [Campylobacter lanienae]MDY5519099.1 30S ribosomal protein S6 [Campylobacter lanienae]MDY6056448.1 30S ribosomal protein S6 [Campylobacter lanienae]MDY6134277.1 30S ribosomal protein S6 [Campylobacter lanienae]
MRHYELLFILKPTLTEDEVKVKADFIKEIITKNGGEIASVVEMGTRKLAYKIDKYERGTYFVIYFKAPTQLIAELVRNLRITEEVIRFLPVKYENKKEIAAWDKLSKGQKLTQPKKESKIEEKAAPQE